MRSADSVPSTHELVIMGLVLLWRLATRPLWAVLVIMEPVVRSLLCGLALLVFLAAMLFKLAGDPNVPVWGMLAVSSACILLLSLYYRVIDWLR